MNLVDAIEEKLGFKLIVKYARYRIDGWYFQDKSPVDCSTCGATCNIFRCPYTTPKGEYRYWAVVCGGCENALTLDDIPGTNKKILQKWDSKTASSKSKSTSQPDSPSAFGLSKNIALFFVTIAIVGMSSTGSRLCFSARYKSIGQWCVLHVRSASHLTKFHSIL